MASRATQERPAREAIVCCLTIHFSDLCGLMRVTAQLFDTGTQARLWGGNFNYPLGDWLELQQQATTDIVGQIGRTLRINQDTPRQATSSDAEAYEHVLLGWHYFDQFRPSTLAQAWQHFTSAVAIDPVFVEAHIGLALTQLAGAFFGIMPAATAYPEAERSANRALELDPGNGEAQAVLGWIEFVYRWNWAESERMMRKAVENQPNSPWTYWLLANYLSAMDRATDAVEAINAALRLDPASPFGLVARGYILSNAGRGAEAVQHWLAVQNRLGLPLIGSFLIEAYEVTGDFDSAVSVAENLDQQNADRLRFAYTEEGEEGYWKAMAARKKDFIARYPGRFSWRYAVTMSKIGEPDAAIDMLERGYYQRNPRMVYLPIYPLQALYREPRFQDLVKTMNLQDVMKDVMQH